MTPAITHRFTPTAVRHSGTVIFLFKGSNKIPVTQIRHSPAWTKNIMQLIDLHDYVDDDDTMQ